MTTLTDALTDADWSGASIGSKLLITAAIERLRTAEVRVAELEAQLAASPKWFEAYSKAVSIGARYEEQIEALKAQLAELRGRKDIVAWQSKGEPWKIILDRDIEEVRKTSGCWLPLNVVTVPPAASQPVTNSEAEHVAGVLENIGMFEPEDIESDDADLRFEDENGCDTGCTVSITEYARRGAEVIGKLLASQPMPTHEATDWQVNEAIAHMESEADMVLVPRGLLGAARGAITHPFHESGRTLGALRHYCRAQKVSQPYTVPDEAPYGYFAFWPEHGEEFFKKREDAIAFCKEAIEDYRRENADEGCDDRDVARTCWGVIMQKGAVIEVDDEGHIDFSLTDELSTYRAAMLQSGNSLVWSGVDWAKGCEPVAHVDKRSAATGSICWTPTGRSLNLEHGTPLFVGNSPVIPVRYMNRFTGACFTLEQQPNAATDTDVYIPLVPVRKGE